MKKIVAIIIFSVLLLGFGLFEYFYNRAVFTELNARVLTLTEQVKESKETTDKIDSAENIAAATALDTYWDDTKNVLRLMYNNHTLVNIEATLARLHAAIATDEYGMACTELEQLYRSVCEQLRFNGISLENIF